MERERAESAEGGVARSRTPKQEPKHTREVIFALPSLQLHLKTEHWQAALTPDVSGNHNYTLFIFILIKNITLN